MGWATLALSVAGADAQSLRGGSPSKTSDSSFESVDRVVNSSSISTLLQEQAGGVENYMPHSSDRAESKAAENSTNDLPVGFNTSKPSVTDTSLDALKMNYTLGVSVSWSFLCWGCEEAASYVVGSGAGAMCGAVSEFSDGALDEVTCIDFAETLMDSSQASKELCRYVGAC